MANSNEMHHESPISPALSLGRPYEQSARSISISSDRTSVTGAAGLLSPPPGVAPEPAFIAMTAASQIITNDHETRLDSWLEQYGVEPSNETAVLLPKSLLLVNSFLDQLLFQILSVAKSTSLTTLRTSVAEVLKPKLAGDAIYGADEELKEYLGEEDEMAAFHNGHEPNIEWDLELVWKRTRLRCMVYSSLGDMEEEDEDYYAQQFSDDPTSNTRISRDFGVISPAVAIFLTSILEFVGEQVLLVAGQAAYHRLRAKLLKEKQEGRKKRTVCTDPIVVEETDVEKLALDRTLGRLWRTWRNRLRSPTSSISMARSFSIANGAALKHSGSRKDLYEPDVEKDGKVEEIIEERPSDEEKSAEEAIPEEAAELEEVEPPSECQIAAQTALPVGPDDVREIEVPGVAEVIYDEDEEQPDEEDLATPESRRKTMIMWNKTNFPSSDPTEAENRLEISKSLERAGSDPSASAAARAAARAAFLKANPSIHATQEDTEEAQEQAVTQELIVTEQSEQEVATDVPSTEKVVIAEQPEPKHEAEVEIESGSEAHDTGADTGAETEDAYTDAAEDISPVSAESDEDPFGRQENVRTPTDITVKTPIVEEKTPRSQPEDTSEERKSPSKARPAGIIVGAAAVAESAAAAAYSNGEARKAIEKPSRAAPPMPIRTDSLEARPRPLASHPAYKTAGSREVTPRASSASPKATELQKSQNIARRDVSGGSSTSRKEVPPNNSSTERVDPRANIRDVRSIPDEVVASAALRSHPVSSNRPSDKIKSGAQQKPFVLGNAPNTRGFSNEKSRPPAPLRSASHVSENPAPLSPLRELADGGPEASDGSSMGASHSAQSLSDSLDHSQGHESRFREEATPRSSISQRQRSDTAKSRSEKPARPSHIQTASVSSFKRKPVRTSEDGTPIEIQDKARSFEELIQSDQTIQYTLTPQNMRDMEPSVSHIQNGESRRRTSMSSHASVSKLSNSSPKDTPRSGQSPAKPRTGGPQARDARVNRDSIGDFADFIRSTGPPGFDKTRQPSAASSQRPAPRNSNSRSGSMSATPSMITPVPIRRAESSAGRTRLQARAAVVPQRNDTSDLIDFIRQGPPSLAGRSNRVPTNVAPFDDATNSSQMSGAIPRNRSLDQDGSAGQVGSTYSYDQSKASVNSSINSQTALLNGPTSNKASMRPVPASRNADPFDMPDGMPQRTRRRIRDPYAIDYSDEDEELEALEEFANTRPKPKQQKEESLIDFLNSVPPPPPPPDPTPLIDPNSERFKQLKKKSSAPNLIARLSRKDSSNVNNSNSLSKTRSNVQVQSRTQTLPISSSGGYSTPDSFKRNGAYESPGRSDDMRRPSVPPKTSSSSYSSRNPAGLPRTATSDLAEFLRNSEPPPSTRPAAYNEPPMKESRFGMFGRRKKSTAY